METVSGFAAALKQSCDTVEDAGEAANVAVRDMADNSAKMGTSMESIKTAYAGFAKQNYTMLDNLNTMGALAA
jgi:predicted trehalose synthase